MRVLRIYFSFKAQYLKTAMEYKLNFWLMIISGVLMRTLMLAVPYVLFRNMPTIAGFSEGEVYLMAALMFISEGMCNVFFDGIWYIQGMVFGGEFDNVLIRPVSPLFQVLSRELGLHGIGIIVLGIVSIVLSANSMGWLSLGNILLCILFVLCGTVIRASTYLLYSCIIFWQPTGTRSSFTYTAYGIGEYARYPLDIYPGWVRFILLTIIPFGFIGYVPVLLMRGEQVALWAVLLAAMAVVLPLLARQVFYRGIRKYESMGM